jgi:hypothetical protein
MTGRTRRRSWGRPLRAVPASAVLLAAHGWHRWDVGVNGDGQETQP